MNKTNKVHILSDSVFSIQHFFHKLCKIFPKKRFIFQEPIQKVVLFLDVICITVFSRYDTNCFNKSYLELWVKSQRYTCPAQIIISPDIFPSGIFFLHAHSQVFYSNCVKFHQYRFIHLREVVLMRNMDKQTGWFLYTPNILFAGGNKTVQIVSYCEG